jgi:hypothetical protein
MENFTFYVLMTAIDRIWASATHDLIEELGSSNCVSIKGKLGLGKGCEGSCRFPGILLRIDGRLFS